MLFILRQQIVHEALEEGDKQSLLVMASLETCMKYGKHMVFANRDTLEYIKAKAPHDYPTILSLLSSYSTSGATARLMSWHAEFINKGDSYRDENNRVIYINKGELSRLELMKETHMIGEHLKDVQFIKHIMHYYQREHGLSQSYNYYPFLGGGSSIACVYESEVKAGRALVLCITDGDKEHPTDSIGSTGDNVRKIDEDNHHPYLSYYYNMKDVSEMENLIPWNVLEKFVAKTNDPQMTARFNIIRQLKEADESLLSYFDYKEGISKAEETRSDVLKYRIGVISHINPNIKDTMVKDDEAWEAQKTHFLETGIAQDAKEAEKIVKYIRKKMVYVPGVCEKVLEHVLNNFNDELETIKKSDLTEDQIKEYERIGEIACAWTCCHGLAVS